LIDLVGRNGVTVSAPQLERWRKAGWLPRAARLMEGRSGSSCELPPESVELATALGRHARRGRERVDVAIMAWLDGAPVNSRIVASIAQRQLATLYQRHLAGIMSYAPPEGMELGPTFDINEATARWLADNWGKVARQMGRRLAAAGFDNDALGIANAILLSNCWDEDLPRDQALRVYAAFGVARPFEADGSLTEQAASLNRLFRTKLDGITSLQELDLSSLQTVWNLRTGEANITGAEIDEARGDLHSLIATISAHASSDINPLNWALASEGRARIVVFLCLIWAALRRDLQTPRLTSEEIEACLAAGSNPPSALAP
jgi:hypothetical protein